MSVCGELAGDSIGVLILLAMGYRRFSMNLNNIAKVKYLLRRVRTDALAPLLEQAIQLSDSAQIRKIFTNYLESLGLQSFISKKA